MLIIDQLLYVRQNGVDQTLVVLFCIVFLLCLLGYIRPFV